MTSSSGETGEPLSPAHRDEVEPLLQKRRDAAGAPEATLSDATFANLLLFREAHDWRLQRGALPCIAGRAYDGARLLLPLFDPVAVAPEALHERLGAHDAYGPLSEREWQALPPGRFVSTASAADADYLYTAEQFRHYRGTQLQKKANLVRQLLATHRVASEPYHEGLATEAAQVLQGWLHDKAKAAGETDDGPCLRALAEASTLGLSGSLFRVDGQAAGFVLAEALAPGVEVMRFAKARDAFKGLYQHMFQQHCRTRPALQWLNFEQDLGLPHFRQTKQSYQPARLLSKHRVRPLAAVDPQALTPALAQEERGAGQDARGR